MDPSALIGDIVERNSSAKPVHDFAEDNVSSTGFPQHKRRWKASAFKQRRGGGATEEQSSQIRPAPSQATPQSTGANVKMTYDQMEKQRIDQENRQKLDDMSPAEIAEAQRELLSGMNPGLVQRLLQRATIEDSSSTTYAAKNDPEKPADSIPEGRAEKPAKHGVRFATEAQVAEVDVDAEEQDGMPKGRFGLNLSEAYDEDAEPMQRPELIPLEDLPHKTHFPAPPPTDLDPNDPNFLETLHEKYFPSLPNDPSKLAWMAPVPTPDSTADRESPYYPHEEIPVSALRFDFKGRFLSPRVSRSIPSSKGLHHHGEAPEAAGYTVAELAHLGRSAVPAQRCIAYQTLGRILFRLGQGEWGSTENHPIAMGVWNAMKKGRVLDTLNEAAAVEGGHRGSQAFAIEALWLFEKGGWREKVKGR